MATWIEFRCEKRGGDNQGCLSDKNDGPMEMACDTNASVLEVMALLRSVAKKEGWKRTSDGWVCPNCLLETDHD